jgi:hypothetical protein
VYLVGSEDVQKAGHEMAATARTMADALSWHSEALVRHQRFLDEWLARLEELLTTDDERHK